jgi:hypothetical protein
MRKYFREIFVWVVTTALTSGPVAAQLPKRIQLEAVQTMRHSIAEEVAKASPQVQEQAAKIPAPAPAPVAVPNQPPPVVSEGEKAALLAKVNDFQTYATGEKGKYSMLAAAALIAAALLGLVGSIASFLSWSKLGGVASLTAVAVIGFFNAYPVSPLADFYRSLATQATALKVDCDLKEPFTLEAYDSAAAQLKLLYLYEGDKRPKWGSSETVSQDLAGQLQALRSASNRLEAKAN